MRSIKPFVWPPGGHTFIDPDGFMHRAAGWKLLEDKLTEYRERNRLPPGDPHAEIVAQFGERHPHLIYEHDE
jgi:hypothetical protein